MSIVLDVAKSLCFICRAKKCKTELNGFLEQIRSRSDMDHNRCLYHYHYLRRCSNSSSGEDDISLVKSNANEEKNILADFSELTQSLNEMKKICQQREMLQSTASVRVDELLQNLRRITEKWPPFHSQKLLVATETLVELSRCTISEGQPDARQWLAALDRFSLEYNNRVSRYFMQRLTATQSPITRSQSCEDFPLMNEETEFVLNDEIKPENDTDANLMKIKDGVEFSLHHLKLWTKYTKDIISYIEKRTQFEMEYAQQLEKLAQSAKIALKQHVFLPFHSIYCSSVQQDIENATLRLKTATQLQGQTFIDPLTVQVGEVEKLRKHLKDIWNRELKKTHEGVNNLLRAKAMYIQRHQEYDRARIMAQKVESGELNGKVEKKRRVEDDALQKAMEAETTYKACVVEANERQKALYQIKAKLLQQIRHLVYQCDKIMKTLTYNYFELQHNTYSSLPNQIQTLCNRSKDYEIGTQYTEYVNKLPIPNDANLSPVQYIFEPYSPQESFSDSSNTSFENSENWNDTRNHPFLTRRSLSEVEDNESNRHRYSKAAETHSFRKLRTPSKCRRCDNYVYFQGVECSECGLSCHKKCLELLVIQCGHKRLRPKLTTFGVDLISQAEKTGDPIPIIVQKCIAEIERKGCLTKGIYRVSGVKSDIENLCQIFENDPDLVDLSDVPINVITSVLKHYFRQLPEPLIPFDLYSDFIKIAKEYPSKKEEINMDLILRELHTLILRLPPVHYVTLGYLINHLKRISKFFEHNNMPSSNLGIVFGPTLMRTRNDANSISCLMDTIHQTRVIDLLITYSSQLFGRIIDDPNNQICQSYNMQSNQVVNFRQDLSGKLSLTYMLSSPYRRDSWYLTSSTKGELFFLPTVSADPEYRSTVQRMKPHTIARCQSSKSSFKTPMKLVCSSERGVNTARETMEENSENVQNMKVPIRQEYKTIMNPQQSSKIKFPTQKVKNEVKNRRSTPEVPVTSCLSFSSSLSQVQITGLPLSISLTTQFLDGGGTNPNYSPPQQTDSYECSANICMV